MLDWFRVRSRGVFSCLAAILGPGLDREHARRHSRSQRITVEWENEATDRPPLTAAIDSLGQVVECGPTPLVEQEFEDAVNGKRHVPSLAFTCGRTATSAEHTARLATDDITLLLISCYQTVSFGEIHINCTNVLTVFGD